MVEPPTLRHLRGVCLPLRSPAPLFLPLDFHVRSGSVVRGTSADAYRQRHLDETGCTDCGLVLSGMARQTARRSILRGADS